MAELQREAYEDETSVSSDVLGIVDRDNRNHRKKQRIILEETNADRGDLVLEVGCGSGLHAREYARRFRYWGIDLSESLLTEAQERLQHIESDSAHTPSIRRMDMHELDFGSDAFDAVVGTAVLHHSPRPASALREWMRVVKPGGSVTLMEPNYLFPKDWIEARLVAEEENKRFVHPQRIRGILDGLCADYRVEPKIYTPPWPEAYGPIYDHVDDVASRIPVLRSLSQMQLIHVDV